MDKPSWPDFYMEFSGKLITYNDNRQELFEKIRNLALSNPLMGYLHFYNAEFWEQRDYEIDPFTVMAIFNRATSDIHRHDLAVKLAGLLEMDNLKAPESFHGIPRMDPRNSIFAGNTEMWDLMLAAKSVNNLSDEFISRWDKAINVKGNALGTLSMGLFWASPYVYMPVDKMATPLIMRKYGLEPPADKCSGREYVNYINALAQKKGDLSYPQLTLMAWNEAHSPETGDHVD